MNDEEYARAVYATAFAAGKGVCLVCNRRRSRTPHCPECGSCLYLDGECRDCNYIDPVVIRHGMGHEEVS